MLVNLKTSQCIWWFTALPSIDRVLGGINLKCWSFVQRKEKKRKEKGTTLTQFLRTLCLLMAYLNNVEHIVFIALFENACGDLKKKKKKKLIWMYF